MVAVVRKALVKRRTLRDVTTIKMVLAFNRYQTRFGHKKQYKPTIDNSLAERSIRPMTVERKNSLFFCSTEGAKASAIFHTIIETCKLLGISARDYINCFLKEVSLGRTNWQNLMPAKLYQQS